MKRAARWAFNIFAGVSLLLVVATVVLWVRSYGDGDEICLLRADEQGSIIRQRFAGFASNDGLLRVFSSDWFFERAEWAWLQGLAHYTALPQLGAGWGFSDQHEPRESVQWVVGHADSAETFAGIRRYTRTHRRGDMVRYWFIPHAYVGMLFSFPPALALSLVVCRHLPRRFRRLRGLCVNCGYDLRATPGRCPECGTVAGGLPDAEKRTNPP